MKNLKIVGGTKLTVETFNLYIDSNSLPKGSKELSWVGRMKPKFPNAVQIFIEALVGANYDSFEKAYADIKTNPAVFEKFL